MINVINVSVTDSFHSSCSEQGDADADNYDSDKCQEYDLRNCYAALIDIVLVRGSLTGNNESNSVLFIHVTPET